MKKIVALLLAVMMVASLAACGPKTDGGDDANGAAQLKILDTEYVTEDYAIAVAKGNSELLEQINTALATLKDNGALQQVMDYYISGTGELPTFQQDVAADAEVLTMATNAEFPPYESYDNADDEKIVGIDAVVAGLIADELGMKLEISDMGFDSIIPSVVSGKADMAMAGLTVTDERKESVDFSEPYATGVQVVIVRSDSEINSPDDIATMIADGKDVQIGAQIATTGYIYASDTPENGGYGEEHVQAFPKGADAVQALLTGKIDCVIIDNEPAKAFVEANNG